LGRYACANVVLPAPFGPATIKHLGLTFLSTFAICGQA
jgi:hypothetical protein